MWAPGFKPEFQVGCHCREGIAGSILFYPSMPPLPNEKPAFPVGVARSEWRSGQKGPLRNSCCSGRISEHRLPSRVLDRETLSLSHQKVVSRATLWQLSFADKILFGVLRLQLVYLSFTQQVLAEHHCWRQDMS